MQGWKKKATINDALAYVRAVKETFSDNEETYNEFLQVLKDFTAHRIDGAVVVARVKELFKGHQKLISGFNKFLPDGFRVPLSPEDTKRHLEIALNFLSKVRSRLQGEQHVYNSFLEIMSMAKGIEKTSSEAYDEVSFLLQDYEDLLEEFTIFLPGNSAMDTNENEQKYAVDVSNAENNILNVGSDHAAENCSSCGVSDSSNDETGLKCQHGNSAMGTKKNERRYAVDVSDAENNKLNVESGSKNCGSCGVSDSSDDEIGLKCQHCNSPMDTKKNEHKYTVDVSGAENKFNVECDPDVSDSSEDEIGLKSVCSQDCEKLDQRDPD